MKYTSRFNCSYMVIASALVLSTTCLGVAREVTVRSRSSTNDALEPARRPTVNIDKRPFEEKPAVDMPFYILNNRILPPVMNFALSGFMGDAADLRVSGGYSAMLRDGFPTLRVTYSAAGGTGWAGAVWQNPANNWGKFDGGYNLSNAKSLSFWAKGERGGEIVSFNSGGTAANYPDSDSVSTGDLELSDTWRQYIVDLSEVNMMYISAGFGFAVKRDLNPYGCTFFLDDIRFE